MVERRQPGRLVPLFISCDPERDSPAALKDYLRDFHPSIIGITGEPLLVREAAKLFRVYFKAARTSATDPEDYLVDHTIFYYLMDPHGRYVTHFGRDHRAEEVAATIIQTIGA